MNVDRSSFASRSKETKTFFKYNTAISVSVMCLFQNSNTQRKTSQIHLNIKNVSNHVISEMQDGALMRNHVRVWIAEFSMRQSERAMRLRRTKEDIITPTIWTTEKKRITRTDSRSERISS